jgi:CRP-like cAMP-binding protein
MSRSYALPSPGGVRARQADDKLQSVLLRLVQDGPEQRAIEAGEIDALIDYSGDSVILFPAARHALRKAAKRPLARRSVANSLLAALPRQEYQRLRADLEPVTLKLGEVLHEPGVAIRYVYFPVDSVVCLLATVENHRTLEVGLVGYEGMVGASLALGVNVSSVRALVQVTGAAMRMGDERFREAFRQNGTLRRALHRYTYAKLALARQTVACSSFHLIEERLARWLLMTSDRVRSDRFFLTQEFLADILGARRVSVTQAAGRLQESDLITYHRGNIRILNRKGLEAASCRCYARIKDLSDRV